MEWMLTISPRQPPPFFDLFPSPPPPCSSIFNFKFLLLSLLVFIIFFSLVVHRHDCSHVFSLRIRRKKKPYKYNDSLYYNLQKEKNQYIIKSNGVDIETNPFKFLENTRTKNFQIRINL